MNVMTNLSTSQLPGGWIAVGVIMLVLGIVFLVTRRRGVPISSVEEEELPIGIEPSVSPTAPPAAAAGEDDAMMAAVIGAIAANEEQGAILAAITAAISVVWESEHPGTSFRVVSYRHIEKRSPWNAR